MNKFSQKMLPIATGAMVVLASTPIFASETPTFDVSATLTTAFTSAGAEIMKVLGVALVAGIGIVGVTLAAKKGIGFFQQLVRKG